MRDVTFGEDASRVRKGSGPQVMAAIRNAAIGFLRFTGATNIAEITRRNGSQVEKLFGGGRGERGGRGGEGEGWEKRRGGWDGLIREPNWVSSKSERPCPVPFEG